MDEIDYAQEIQEAELRRLITAHADALPRGESAMECLDCGGAIPGDRRRACPGCTRCVQCQSVYERMRKERE